MKAAPKRPLFLLGLLGVLALAVPTLGHGAPAAGVESAVQSVSDDVMSGAGWLSDSAREFSNPTVFVQTRQSTGVPEEATAQLVSIGGAAASAGSAVSKSESG